jgi:hypothetical protein
MADEVKACSVCFCDTKYACIKCKKTICNVCGSPEIDEDTDGWIYGKQVSYCYLCKWKINLVSKRKSIIAGAVPSDEQRETQTRVTDAHAKIAASGASDTSLSTSNTRYNIHYWLIYLPIVALAFVLTTKYTSFIYFIYFYLFKNSPYLHN